MKKAKLWIVIAAIAAILVGIASVLLWRHFSQNPPPSDLDTTENQQAVADVRDILGTTVTSTRFLRYLDNGTENDLEDEFSKVYSESVKIKVSDLDETSQTATIEVLAPPLRAIFEDAIPTDTSGDFDAVLNQYRSDIQGAISECPPETMVISTVTCSVIGEDDLKIVPNNDLFDAMFPDIQSLLAELLTQMLVDKEG